MTFHCQLRLEQPNQPTNTGLLSCISTRLIPISPFPLPPPTGSKWKPATVGADASRVYKLVRLESLSAYWNPYCERGRLDSEEARDSWRDLMADTLNTMAVSEEKLDFRESGGGGRSNGVRYSLR